LTQGIKINSPHYLLKLDLDAGEHNLTLVVSQYEKSTTIRYSVKAFCTAPFSMRAIPPPESELKITSEVLPSASPHRSLTSPQWKVSNAGGCPNDQASYERNPKFSFTVR
jgi:calpain-7